MKFSLIKLFRIVPVTGPRSVVLAPASPRVNTADLGPVTGPNTKLLGQGNIRLVCFQIIEVSSSA